MLFRSSFRACGRSRFLSPPSISPILVLETRARVTSFVLPVLCFVALSACANDKNLHFVAGAAASKHVTHQTQSPISGCAAALTAGIAKEVYDSNSAVWLTLMMQSQLVLGCLYGPLLRAPFSRAGHPLPSRETLLSANGCPAFQIFQHWFFQPSPSAR